MAGLVELGAADFELGGGEWEEEGVVSKGWEGVHCGFELVRNGHPGHSKSQARVLVSRLSEEYLERVRIYFQVQFASNENRS